MADVNISYNGNKENEFYILPEENGVKEKFVNGVRGCIEYFRSFPYPIILKFNENSDENKFSTNDRKDLAYLVEMHNQREHIASQIKKPETIASTPLK